MPIRTSSLTKRISQNGQALHLAREKRLAYPIVKALHQRPVARRAREPSPP